MGAGGIHFDLADQGLSVFLTFRVIWNDVHFAKPRNVLLERLSDGLARCSPFEFRPRVGSPCWWHVACPGVETEPNTIFRTESGILTISCPEI